MPSITGAVRLVKYLKHEKAKKAKAKPRKMKCYQRRDELLSAAGFGTYYDYLKSDAWSEIRDRVLRHHPRCRGCGGDATQLHHWSYDIEVILGTIQQLLIPVCSECHEKAEFEDGEKVPLWRANQRLVENSDRPKGILDRVDVGLKLIKKRRKLERKLAKDARMARNQAMPRRNRK